MQDPTILETTNATLVVYTEDVDPALLTEAIGVAPTWTARKGDPGSGGEPLRFGLWKFSSRGVLKGVDVDVHVRWLLDRLEPGAKALATQLHEHRWRAVLSMYACLEDVNRVTFGLPAREVARVAAFGGVDLRVGIIIFADDDHVSAVVGDVTDAAFTLGDTTISSEDEVDSEHLGEHVTWLLPWARTLRAIEPDGPARLTLTWARDISNAGIGLAPETVAGVAALRADLSYILMTAD